MQDNILSNGTYTHLIDIGQFVAIPYIAECFMLSIAETGSIVGGPGIAFNYPCCNASIAGKSSLCCNETM